MHLFQHHNVFITHMRGDLSLYFVQNGSKTGMQIDVYEDSYH